MLNCAFRSDREQDSKQTTIGLAGGALFVSSRYRWRFYLCFERRLVVFALGFLLYLIKAMSAGDVKLLGVVGYVIGLHYVPQAMFYVLISAGLIASYYLFYNLSFLGLSNPLLVLSEPKLLTGSNYNGANNNVLRYQNRLTMPFAPAVAIGLAMFFYFL